MPNATLQPETLAELDRVPRGTVAAQSQRLGLSHDEPLLLALDGLLRYAKAYVRRFGYHECPNRCPMDDAAQYEPGTCPRCGTEREQSGRVADDGVLGPCWLDAAKGLRGLLNGDGAVAMERGVTTDSKDNGALEGIFWHALHAAGFGEGDL